MKEKSHPRWMAQWKFRLSGLLRRLTPTTKELEPDESQQSRCEIR